MRIKKLLICMMVVCFIATMILSGCGSTDNSSNTTSNQAATVEKTTAAVKAIVFPAINID